MPHPASASIRTRFRSIIATQMGKRVDDITEGMTFVEMGCDEIDLLEIRLEAATAFRLDDARLEDCLTVGDAATQVERHAFTTPRTWVKIFLLAMVALAVLAAARHVFPKC
jgi:acyl carrier protein